MEPRNRNPQAHVQRTLQLGPLHRVVPRRHARRQRLHGQGRAPVGPGERRRGRRAHARAQETHHRAGVGAGARPVPAYTISIRIRRRHRSHLEHGAPKLRARADRAHELGHVSEVGRRGFNLQRLEGHDGDGMERRERVGGEAAQGTRALGQHPRAVVRVRGAHRAVRSQGGEARERRRGQGQGAGAVQDRDRG